MIVSWLVPLYTYYLRVPMGRPLELVLLLTTVTVIGTKVKKSKEQMVILKSYLGVSHNPDEYYPRTEGSCQ